MEQLGKAFSDYATALTLIEWLQANHLLVDGVNETPEELAEQFALSGLDLHAREQFACIKKENEMQKALIKVPGLGLNQRKCLVFLVEHYGYPGDGWLINSRATTIKTLDSMVNIGLAEKSGSKYSATYLGKVLLRELYRRGLDRTTFE